MNDVEKRAYLHNLAVAARADHVVVAEETSLVHALIAEYGVEREVWEEVLAAVVESGDDAHVDLRPISRFSDRVRCLEDMIEIAYCDGRMDEAEKGVLFRAARDVGIPESRVVQLVEEARVRAANR